MDSNIIGNGMIASAFRNNIHNIDNVCYFASGVSNSMCRNEIDFIREKDLIKSTFKRLKKSVIFVYFSTCSIYDDTINTMSGYVQHKKNMEKLVLERGNAYILRLPQLAGISSNKYTLLNYLRDSIAHGDNIDLQVNATRNIIDVVDVVYYTNEIIKLGKCIDSIVNVACTYSVSVEEVILILEEILNKEAQLNRVNSGSQYDIDVGIINEINYHNRRYFSSTYIPKVLTKYYSIYRNYTLESSCLSIM